MKNLIEKFEKENEVLIKNHLEDVDKILRRRQVAVAVGIILILVHTFCLLFVVEEQGRNDVMMFLLALCFFGPVVGILLVHTVMSVPVKSKMYTRLNFKAKNFIQDEILSDIRSFLRKHFIVDSYFEERIVILIKNQKKWIDDDGVLITYQRIDDKSLLMKRDNITYYLFYWSYSVDGFKIEYGRDFVLIESRLLIEENGNSILINK